MCKPNPDLAGLTEEETKRIGKIAGGIFEDRVEIAQVNLKLGIGVGMRPSSVIDLARTILKIDATAERRLALLEKHEWFERSNGTLVCICCLAVYLPDANESGYLQGHKIIKLGKGKVCTPDCALAAELRGGGGKT